MNQTCQIPGHGPASFDPRERVSRELLHSRTAELARSAGRDIRSVRQGDYEQAKRELTGEADLERQEARLA
jgi:hypothetical protein